MKIRDRGIWLVISLSKISIFLTEFPGHTEIKIYPSKETDITLFSSGIMLIPSNSDNLNAI